MKCSKCNAEWTTGSVKSQLSTCPFCGASLVSETATGDDLTMPDVMARIVEHFGEEILSQERKCLAAFKDFAPKLETEQKILKIALGEGVADYFLHCPVTERASHRQKAREAMGVLLSDTASLLVVDSFAMALGWDVSGVKQGKGDSTEATKKEADKMFEKGESCCKGRNFQEAMEWFRKAADAGNAAAMHSIGYMYSHGIGVTQDYGEAMEWFRKAADAGNAAAMNNIGYMYHHGEDVAQDYGEAMKWYRKAADVGNMFAMKNIGDMYRYGSGVAQDYSEALQWYRKAADAGSMAAKFIINPLQEKMEHHYKASEPPKIVIPRRTNLSNKRR